MIASFCWFERRGTQKGSLGRVPSGSARASRADGAPTRGRCTPVDRRASSSPVPLGQTNLVRRLPSSAHEDRLRSPPRGALARRTALGLRNLPSGHGRLRHGRTTAAWDHGSARWRPRPRPWPRQRPGAGAPEPRLHVRAWRPAPTAWSSASVRPSQTSGRPRLSTTHSRATSGLPSLDSSARKGGTPTSSCSSSPRTVTTPAPARAPAHWTQPPRKARARPLRRSGRTCRCTTGCSGRGRPRTSDASTSICARSRPNDTFQRSSAAAAGARETRTDQAAVSSAASPKEGHIRPRSMPFRSSSGSP